MRARMFRSAAFVDQALPAVAVLDGPQQVRWTRERSTICLAQTTIRKCPHRRRCRFR